MTAEFLHVGFENIIAVNRVLAILGPGSAPVKRLMREAVEGGRLIDMTNGRKTLSVIVLDTGHVALAALQPATIAARLDVLRGLPPHKPPPNAPGDEA